MNYCRVLSLAFARKLSGRIAKYCDVAIFITFKHENCQRQKCVSVCAVAMHTGGADKSLARPGRKQATATKLARRLTCFLLDSVTRKDLQFGT